MKVSSDGLIYNYVEELQTLDPKNTEVPGFASAHWAQYHQLQAPQHVQQLQDSQRQSTSSGMSGYSSEQYDSPPGLPQRAQNDGTTRMTAEDDLSRHVQFMKNELAKGNMTSGSTQGPATTTSLLPFQLPIACEQGLNEAESLLMEESVRQKKIIHLTD
ncbi:hypothetical protein CRENBAI_007360 [Crenichthys baileyi]|uniref:Uncharacterized protein n=1 Tax=Crenichthys baileyi TaxID=28760 RepID=A0AAV9QMA5_9TELE